ncbi:MAG: hypothetical protein IJE26_06280 [Oscillospiraceae bacterium]|nr:hypothetical protein [Oscillospiraceae bacterium]
MRFYNMLALLLAALLLAGCGVTSEEILGVIAPTEPPLTTSEVSEAAEEEDNELPPEEQGCETLLGCFSPFFATADGDLAVVDATQLSLLAEGGHESPSIISSATNEDGTFTVTIEIRGGLRFADGMPVDADDLLFTYYVLLDPGYTGPYALDELPIVGLSEYRTGVNAALYEEYGEMFDEIYAGGKYDEELRKALKAAEDAVPHNSWDEQQAQKALDEYDQDKANEIKETIQLFWRSDVGALVDFCMEKFGNTVEYHTGYTYEEVAANEGLQIMYAMVEWSFATLTEDGVLVAKKSGRSWDLESSFPTEEDFFQEMTESYGGDAETYWQIEGIGRGDLISDVRNSLIAKWAAEDEEWDGGVKHIAGIERVGDRLIRVTFEYYDATFLDTLCNVYLAPMHWYGSESLYDYAAGSYGFPFGDVSSLKGKNTEPMGAGSFKLESYDGMTAALRHNGNYWLEQEGNPRLEISARFDA